MANQTGDKLYNLMPAAYRERDALVGEPLRALLAIIEQQADILDADIRRLWDNFFIELCDPWVIPYIGDLVGTVPLFDESRVKQQDTPRALFDDLTGPRLIPDVGIRSRADVAKTIYYRRRKGTLPMLEELARDVTGWGAHAVEFFELLGWTECVRNHLRLHSRHGAELRSLERADAVHGPFDGFSHMVDVRPISPINGWHNIKNIGFFVWRLRSYEAEAVDARRLGPPGDFRYFFSPLGNSAPLFTRWRREGDEAGLATELHVPGPIRPASFFEDLREHQALPLPLGFTRFYGLFDVLSGSGLPQAPASSLMVIKRSGATRTAVAPEHVRCMNLSNWQQPTGNLVGIDVARGRIALGPLINADFLEVYYHYGFSADLGGGPYRRRAWLVDRKLANLVLSVDKSGATGTFTTIGAALTEWSNQGKPNAVISIRDNRTYEESLSIEPADERWLVIEAADEGRPHVRLSATLEITGSHPDASVTFSGLLIEGGIEVTGDLGRLRLLHTTLVPGGTIAEQDPIAPPPSSVPASITVDAGTATAPINQELRLEIAFSIVGPLRVPEHAKGLWVIDSIIDGVNTSALAATDSVDEPGPPLWLERVTIFGRSYSKEITLASEVVFDAPVQAARQQAGCVRFSFLPETSVTPRRYRCQPDLRINSETEAAEQAAQAAGQSFGDPERNMIAGRVYRWLLPSYTSRRYGDPGYAQLNLTCPREIANGAEDGSEMGVFCHLKQPQREVNLRLRLGEYLPFGLEAGLINVT